MKSILIFATLATALTVPNVGFAGGGRGITAQRVAGEDVVAACQTWSNLVHPNLAKGAA